MIVTNLIYLEKDSEAKDTFADFRTFQSYQNRHILGRKVKEIGKNCRFGDRIKQQVQH